ncbi:TPA: hypothetical protein U5D81_003631 [Yersinia enterocolitica]|nr:hypothetical protein [Yersinia enterocolitica]HDL6936509.1 hypothetical protein [Yersinia enterocolitica]HEN3402349.1 hypothetical protein [Yersinia enterocolitica]HEN3424657.1 hypothetical protein [Yersinia enterocolitica]
MMIVFIPKLQLLLAEAQRVKGSKLTDEEIISIRDSGTAINLPFEVAMQFNADRGGDIDPENCIVEWNTVRSESN